MLAMYIAMYIATHIAMYIATHIAMYSLAIATVNIA